MLMVITRTKMEEKIDQLIAERKEDERRRKEEREEMLALMTKQKEGDERRRKEEREEMLAFMSKQREKYERQRKEEKEVILALLTKLSEKQQPLERERLEKQERDKEEERDRLERERLEKLERDKEEVRDRLERERLEKLERDKEEVRDRLERERLEKLERDKEEERDRLERERMEKLEREKEGERNRLKERALRAKEKADRDKLRSDREGEKAEKDTERKTWGKMMQFNVGAIFEVVANYEPEDWICRSEEQRNETKTEKEIHKTFHQKFEKDWDHLTKEQMLLARKFVSDVIDVFDNELKVSQTNLVAHKINTGDTQPIRQHSRKLPLAKRLLVDLAYGSPSMEQKEINDYTNLLRSRMRDHHDLVRAKIIKTSDRMKARYNLRANNAGYKRKRWKSVEFFNPKRKKWKSPKLSQNWEGPYKIIKRINDVVYRIQRTPKTKMKVVPLDRLIRYGKDINSDRDDQFQREGGNVTNQLLQKYKNTC